MTELVLGINNCFAVKRWPEPKKWAEIIATELDLRLVQFSYDLLDPRTMEPALTAMAEETVDACRKYGVVIDTCFTGLAAYSFNLLTHPNPAMRMDSLDWYSKAIHLATLLGARGAGGHVGATSWSDYINEERRLYLENVLIECIRFLTFVAAKQRHEVFLWEPMPVVREPPHTISGAKMLLKKVNEGAVIPVKLCIDLGHACAWKVESDEDLNPYSWLKELASESPFIHVQQTDGKADRHWPFTKEFNNKGVIRAEEVVKAIEGSGVNRVALILEIIHSFEAKESQVLEDLKETVKYWKEHL